MRGVLFITVEGMGTGLVGTYGSTIGATPALDAMAAHGIVLDQCFLDSQDLHQQLTSLATGRHALQTAADEPNLWQLLQMAGGEAVFMTDNPAAAEWAADAGCERVLLVEPPVAQAAADKSHECAVVSLFANAAEEIGDGETTQFIWIHSSGLRLPWDAPLAMREQFTDPDDPAPPPDIGPPCFDVNPTTDPDAVVGWGQVAAAQISLIDDCIAMLLSLLANRADADQWVCSLIGLGGVPLGEHGHVGWGKPQLHGEELQCVAIIRPAPAAPIGWRRAELCQLPDVAATILACMELGEPTSNRWGLSLLEWIPSDIPARWTHVHQLAILRTDEQLWLRSPAWSALWQATGGIAMVGIATEDIATGDIEPEAFRAQVESLPVKLYVKPDDRWEVSEIGDRCQHIVEALGLKAAAMLAALAENERERMPVLEDSLCDLLR